MDSLGEAEVYPEKVLSKGREGHLSCRSHKHDSSKKERGTPSHSESVKQKALNLSMENWMSPTPKEVPMSTHCVWFNPNEFIMSLHSLDQLKTSSY